MSVTKKTTSDPAGIWELDDSQLLVRMWMMSDSKLITRPTPIESEGLKLVSEDCDLRKMEMNMKMRMTLKDDEFNQVITFMLNETGGSCCQETVTRETEIESYEVFCTKSEVSEWDAKTLEQKYIRKVKLLSQHELKRKLKRELQELLSRRELLQQ
ncbi:hypothetical protein Tco_0630894, partial [Tanacetum coccineum]